MEKKRDVMADTHTGTCFCGAVEIEATGAPEEMGYCHCNSCRFYSGGPLSAYILWRAEDVRVTKGAEFLGRFNKTGFSERRFCTKCGGHIMTGHPDLGYTDVKAAILPGIAFEPTLHLNYAETVLPIKDGLLKLKDFPAEAGGSGGVMPEELPSPEGWDRTIAAPPSVTVSARTTRWRDAGSPSERPANVWRSSRERDAPRKKTRLAPEGVPLV